MKKRISAALALLLLLTACGGPTQTPAPEVEKNQLIPFAGAKVKGEEPGEASFLYGLVDSKGEVVAEPVFTTARYLESEGDWGYVTAWLNVLLLGKTLENEAGQPEERFALWAGDGSWRTDFIYKEPEIYAPFDLGIPALRQDGVLAFVDPETGREVRTLDLSEPMGEGDFSMGTLCVDPGSGWVSANPYRWTEDGEYVGTPLLYDPEGNLCPLPPEVRWVGSYGDGLVCAEILRDEKDPTSYRRGYVDVTTGEWAIDPVYFNAGGFRDGKVWVANEFVSYFINTAGEPLTDSLGIARPVDHGDYWYVEGELEVEILNVLDRDLNPVDSPLIGGKQTIHLEDGWVCAEVEYETVLARGTQVVELPKLEEYPYRLGIPIAVRGDRVILSRDDGWGNTYLSIIDLEGNIIARLEEPCDYARVTADPVTGEGYVEAYRLEYGGTWMDLYDLDGNLLLAGERNGYGSLVCGLFYTLGTEGVTLTDREAHEVFRWSFPTDGNDTPDSLVYTDWSKLEPYEPKTAVYTRRYEDFTDTLIPADDYGALLSFAGAALTGIEEWSYYEGYYDTFHLYGLVTLEGEVVLDPVLSSAFYLTESDRWGHQLAYSNVMVLGKVFYDEEGWPEERFALCAGDGSWCTDFLYEYNWENYHNISFSHGIPMVQKEGKLVFLDPATGEELRKLDFGSQVEAGEFSLSNFDVDPVTGWTTIDLYVWREEDDWGFTVPLAYDPQGNVHFLPDGIWWVDRYGDGLVPAGGHFDETEPEYIYRYGYVDVNTGEWAFPPVYVQAGSFENGTAWVSDGTGVYLIDTAGTVLTGKYSDTPVRHGDYWYVDENYSRIIEVLDKDMNRVESPLVGVDSYSCLENGWVCGKKGEEWILARGDEVHRFPDSLGNFWDFRDGRTLFYRERGENETAIITITDIEGNVVVRWDQYTSAYFTWDQVTGESYVSAYNHLTGSYWDSLYDLNGNLLTVGKQYGYMAGGLLYTEEDDCAALTTLDGKVIFRWPFFSGVD